MQAHNKPVTKKNTKQLTQQRNKARHSNHQKKKGGGGGWGGEGRRKKISGSVHLSRKQASWEQKQLKMH